MTMLRIDSAANILERELDFTVKEWLRRVNLVPELTDTPLSDDDRTGHLPKLLRDLISRLRLEEKRREEKRREEKRREEKRREEKRREEKPPISASAAEHGKMRYKQRYTPCMLVEESRVFQVSTFGTLQRCQTELDPSQVLLDVMIIADEVDAQLKETMRSFLEAKQSIVAAA